MANKFLSLVVEDSKRKEKKIYRIDNPKTLHVIYNELDNTFLITFIENHKSVVVGTRHMHIVGRTYDVLR